MSKKFFTFLFVFNVFGACALFPAKSNHTIVLIQPKVEKSLIIKDVVQKKFPWIDDHLYSIIEKESAKYEEVNPMLVASLIWKESRGKANAISKKNARGYMQVKPFHHKGPADDLYIPEINIKEGVEELASCYKRKRFRSDIGALKCYNAGPYHKDEDYKNVDYLKEISGNYYDMSREVMEVVVYFESVDYEVI